MKSAFLFSQQNSLMGDSIVSSGEDAASSSNERMDENGEDDADESSSHLSLNSSTGLSSGGGQGGQREPGDSWDDCTTTGNFSLAKEETKCVMTSKRLVFVVIILCAIASSLGVYYYSRQEENEDFESQFHDFALEIHDVSHLEAITMLDAVESFSQTITSFTKKKQDGDSWWPNITLSDYEILCTQNMKLSRSMQLNFSPLVTYDELEAWQEYAFANQNWIDMSLKHQANIIVLEGGQDDDKEGDYNDIRRQDDIPYYVHNYTGKEASNNNDGSPSLLDSSTSTSYFPFVAPVWQQSPVPRNLSIINLDLLSHPTFARAFSAMEKSQTAVMSKVLNLQFLQQDDLRQQPHSFLLQPIFSDFGRTNTTIVGFLTAVLRWDKFFTNMLTGNVEGLLVVIHDSCGDTFTYEINGADATFLGMRDFHHSRYDHLGVVSDFTAWKTDDELSDEEVVQEKTYSTEDHCVYEIRVYPSSKLEKAYQTKIPVYMAVGIAVVFLFTASAFLLYDFFVQRRQDKVMATARRTNAVVSSLFPDNVRDRILHDTSGVGHHEDIDDKRDKNKRGVYGQRRGSAGFGKPFQATGPANSNRRLSAFLDEKEDDDDNAQSNSKIVSKPIADSFPEATVMFGDIVGFTAWSSEREPSQVFTLLETIYAAFDEIAKRRRIFKVETIGDCYVAVAGLPDPRRDHAVAMARFTRDCLRAMNDITNKLEKTLGPGTGDLSMRFGLHSGPVTAGVLRGQRARFQLFGDTVNTASRIESSGARNMIHVSQETADLIKQVKPHWVTPREDLISAKGKGTLQTYWLEFKGNTGASSQSGSVYESETSSMRGDLRKIHASVLGGLGEGLESSLARNELFDETTQRLVDWNSEMLANVLKEVIAHRALKNAEASFDTLSVSRWKRIAAHDGGSTVFDEVVEMIQLPDEESRRASVHGVDIDTIELDPLVETQMVDYVCQIALNYRQNPFHSFEHASHVTMSVVKLLSRIVSTDKDEYPKQALQSHTSGITDPLTRFACIFAALIHDVDHTGVPNAQLVKECNPLATKYHNTSVAEQRSVDCAWGMLMEPRYGDFRAALCSNELELKRFRQLVVNSVMATDIVDKRLKEARNARWEKVFSNGLVPEEESYNKVNLQATIFIEHLIQASDVAHTMQHWFIFRKWNERLFHELYKAFREGRSEKDPCDFWYKGELGFFDFYIIPLAKKLKDCGVFGAASNEYLTYSEKNRAEWEVKGEAVVADMAEKLRKQYDDQDRLGDSQGEDVEVGEEEEEKDDEPSTSGDAEAWSSLDDSLTGTSPRSVFKEESSQPVSDLELTTGASSNDALLVPECAENDQAEIPSNNRLPMIGGVRLNGIVESVAPSVPEQALSLSAK